jgi:hypothetical protein
MELQKFYKPALIQKIEVKNFSVNLVDFYLQDKNQFLEFSGTDFKKIVEEATENCTIALVNLDNETIFQYENIVEISDEFRVIADLNGSPIDLATAAGRLEARKILAILAYLLKKQSEGEDGALKKKNITSFGWFKLSSGVICHAYVFRSSNNTWVLYAYEIYGNKHPKGGWIWSRNSFF